MPWCCSWYPQWQHQLHLQTHSYKLKTWKWLLVWVFNLPNFSTRGKIALGIWWHINPHGAYRKLMLHGYFLARDHFHIWQVCTWSYRKRWSLSAWLHFPWLVCDTMAVTFLDMFSRSRSNAKAHPRVLSSSTSGSELPYPIQPCTSLYSMPARPTWPFQSPHGIRNSELAVTAHSWSKYRSLTLSLKPLCGAYRDRKVTTRWPTISFTKMILSEVLQYIYIWLYRA